MRSLKIKTEQDFWNLIDRSKGPESCWLWGGTRQKSMYGSVFFEGKTWPAHRLAFRLTYPTIELERWHHICHSCDNPPCCNPNHLWKGNALQNVRDMINKGRSSAGKLSYEQMKKAREMYLAGTTQRAIAHQFGVSQVAIHAIVTGKVGELAGGECSPKQIRQSTDRKYTTGFTREEVTTIRLRRANGERVDQLAREFGVTARTISRLIHCELTYSSEL